MNVVWFCLDTLRADHLGCYGYFRPTSPTMDRLAEEGVLFPQSRANAVATGPAFTSMFTGQYAVNNEWYVTPFDKGDILNFSDNRPVLPEWIQDHGGITTAAFDNLFQFASHMKQFVRGFEYYVNVTRTSRPIHHHVVGGEVNKRLLPWIRAHRAESFFLFVHYWDPHTPYNQPEAYARPFVHTPGQCDDLPVQDAAAGYRYVPGWGTVEQIPATEHSEGKVRKARGPHKYAMSIDSYDGEILYTDHLIGEVVNELDAAGCLAETAIVINADHGEQLNQHYDCWGHPGLHEANIWTPLILWRPGLLPAGARPEGYVHHIDVAPTILNLLGIETPDEMDGRSLLPLVRGEGEPRTHHYAEAMGMRCVMRDGYKYIWHKFAPDELYNVVADPMEVVNLVAREPERLEALRTELFEWVAQNLGDRVDSMGRQLIRCEELRGQPTRYL
ncbi:MAG: sulfatase [Kiritimatiellae bacterium]|nr:sulfatase [Kiritimatiellia bacterium]